VVYRRQHIADPHTEAPHIVTGLIAGTRISIAGEGSALALSPDGRTLAAGNGGMNGAIQLIDVSDPAHPVPLIQLDNNPGNSTAALAFSPDGRTLASGDSKADAVRLWTVTDPAHPVPLHSLTGRPDCVEVTPSVPKYCVVDSVAFSGDGHTLVTASVD